MGTYPARAQWRSVLHFYGTRRQLPQHRNTVSDQADRGRGLIDHHGLVRARDVQRAGIRTVVLTRLVRAGLLDRVARGLYARASAPVSEHVSLAEVAKLAPKGVIRLLSALAFHGLGNQNPHRVWLALPHKATPPSTAPVRLAVVRMHPRALEALKAYWTRNARNPEALRRYARIDGVEKVLPPYLEALAA